ncbi:hypothetical protein BC629DRAFT_1726536 [Irpex lacteus]|nr:hypothetical protein BC629DRAFT_1726536 [Irpex lacteus]
MPQQRVGIGGIILGVQRYQGLGRARLVAHKVIARAGEDERSSLCTERKDEKAERLRGGKGTYKRLMVVKTEKHLDNEKSCCYEAVSCQVACDDGRSFRTKAIGEARVVVISRLRGARRLGFSLSSSTDSKLARITASTGIIRARCRLEGNTTRRPSSCAGCRPSIDWGGKDIGEMIRLLNCLMSILSLEVRCYRPESDPTVMANICYCSGLTRVVWANGPSLCSPASSNTAETFECAYDILPHRVLNANNSSRKLNFVKQRLLALTPSRRLDILSDNKV